MSLKRTLIRGLDNRLGRPLLARLGTLKARQILEEDVEIGFAEGWYHRVGPHRVPDGPRFEYFEPNVLFWKNEISTYLRDAEDFWFIGYRPKLGDVIMDIGAGRGESILPFAYAVGEAGKVFAIEAHPTTFKYLERFCELNK